jgi:hypothetical protein
VERSGALAKMSATAAPMKPKKGALAGQSSFDMSSAERVSRYAAWIAFIHTAKRIKGWRRISGIVSVSVSIVLLRVDSRHFRAFGGTGIRGKLRGDRGATCGKYFRSHTRMALDASMLQQFEMMLQALL